MTSKQILVTGGKGFVGSSLVDQLLERGHHVRIFDNLDPQVHTGGTVPDYANLEAEFVTGYVRDYDAFKKALDGIQVVYHLGQSQYQIKHYVNVNAGGTANLLDILVNHKNHRLEKMIVAASQSSYGEGTNTCPTDRPQPPGRRARAELEARGLA